MGFACFEKAYNEALATINCFLNDDSAGDLRKLTAWLMDTDANPYSFLPHEWAGSLGSAESFAGLLHFIHHAAYDDGDICFVMVNGEPRIVFAHPEDKDFRERVLSEQEQDIATRPQYCAKYDIQVLDINANDFGDVYDAWHANWIRECFISDAEQFDNVNYAAEHYRKYACWQESWITDCVQEIDALRQLYAPLRNVLKNNNHITNN